MRIETDRLILRGFNILDVDAVFNYMSDHETSLYIEQGCLNKAQVKNFVNDNLSKNAQCYVIQEKQTDCVIGHMEFYACFGDHTFEIGWIINKKYQRQGFASEAAKALFSYAFNELGVHRIIATCQPENKASHQLMEKMGMLREGYFRQCIPKGDDVWWDEYAYGILHEDYRNII